MSEEFNFEESLKALQSGQSLTGKDGILTPLIKKLTEAALANLDDARRTAAFDAQQAFLGVVNGVAQVRALEVALKSSLSALESNKLGYEVGVRISIDVLNAEQQVFLTRRDLIKARFDALLAQLKLKAAVGALEEADLEEVNRLFERRKNG